MRRILSLLLVVVYAVSANAQSAPAPANHEAPRLILAGYDRAIQLLDTGVRQHWSPEQFQKAFAAAYGPAVLTGERITACGLPVMQLLQPRSPWDERSPFALEAKRALERCRQQRAQFQKMFFSTQ